MSNNNTSVLASKAYDDVPYTSFPFGQTNPELARSVGYLFGLNAPDPSTSRILELGCASGNNILSIAARYPESTCVGIDYSEKQIEDGNKNIKASGIKNIRLEQKSILDITKEFGEFDYIICHGVFSWVPREVQDKILQVCRDNLSQDGIAYISYNTMPGWSAVQGIREMMLYHTANFKDPKQKAEQSRLLLKFISDSLKSFNKTFYTDVIQNELNILNNQSDFYLLHEHLEENNIQYYFHQFMEMANTTGLQYLGDTSLSSMFSGNMPKETAAVLAGTDDIVRMEQYMDFINNRRFRTTLLCHKERILRRNINWQHIADKYFTSSFMFPDNFATEYKPGTNQNVELRSPANLTLTTNDTYLVTAIVLLNEGRNVPIHLPELAKMVLKRLAEQKVSANATEEQVVQLLATHFLRCIFSGGVSLYMNNNVFKLEAGDKPELFKLARFQAETQDWVTNMRQETIRVNPFDKALMPLLNGKNSVDDMIEQLLPLFRNKTLTMNENDKPVTDEKVIAEKLPTHINALIKRYGELAFYPA